MFATAFFALALCADVDPADHKAIKSKYLRLLAEKTKPEAAIKIVAAEYDATPAEIKTIVKYMPPKPKTPPVVAKPKAAPEPTNKEPANQPPAEEPKKRPKEYMGLDGDRFKNRTDYYVAWPLEETEESSVLLQVRAERDDENKRMHRGVSLTILSIGLTKKGWRFIREHDVDMLVDGKSITVKTRHESQIKELAVGEVLTASIDQPIADKLASAKTLEMRVGNVEHKFTALQLSGLKLICQIPKTEGMAARFAAIPGTNTPKGVPIQTVLDAFAKPEATK